MVTPATLAGSRRPAHEYATSDYYAIDDQQGVARALLLRVTKIEQLDHAWSGGDASVPFNAKTGPDASKMMLDFFARHQRM